MKLNCFHILQFIYCIGTEKPLKTRASVLFFIMILVWGISFYFSGEDFFPIVLSNFLKISNEKVKNQDSVSLCPP